MSKTFASVLATATFLLGIGGGYMLNASAGPTDICTMGPYCAPCSGTACPQGDAGWLCCNASSGVCVIAGASCGSGHVFGYCENYTRNSDGSVTCHDEV